MATQDVMNHGPFYRSSELVAGVHKAEGYFAGFRAAHAYGRIYSGTFTATPLAKTLSRAAHFQGTPVPVTARLSGASGDPNQKPSNVVAMATKFYLPDGTVTDLIAITLPAFFVHTPEEFLDFTEARTLNPATGQPDLATVREFLAHHPNAARVFHLLQSQPALVSFAQVSYRPLHTYRFVNAAGEGHWARYHWEPEAGVAGQPAEELEKQPHEYLYQEFERRLQQGPVAFRLELELAQEGDPVDDPSAMWPDGRERLVVGRLELSRPITEAEIGDPEMMHDPTAVTDGIEISPGDQIIAARRGAYLVSLAERKGGWKHRSPVLAQGCPFHAQTNSRASVHEPIQPRLRTIDGVAVRFAESERNGTQYGDALLLSPWPESLYAFEPMWSRLAETAHLVAIDLPGFGRSERKDALMSPRAMGEFIIRVADAFGLGHLHIVGPDVGTAAALFATAAQPGRFRSLVVGTGGTAVPIQLGDPLREWVFAKDLEPYRRIGGRPIVERALQTLERYALSDTAREDYLVSYDGDRFAESIRYVQSYPTELEILRDVLPQIQTPVQIIAGSRDKVVPPVNAEYLHERLPHSRLHLIDSGHFAWEDAADEYASLVTAWWAGGYKLPREATLGTSSGGK
jgi:pimeloyl-ACP methyl ester carboxylesterase